MNGREVFEDPLLLAGAAALLVPILMAAFLAGAFFLGAATFLVPLAGAGLDPKSKSPPDFLAGLAGSAAFFFPKRPALTTTVLVLPLGTTTRGLAATVFTIILLEAVLDRA